MFETKISLRKRIKWLEELKNGEHKTAEILRSEVEDYKRKDAIYQQMVDKYEEYVGALKAIIAGHEYLMDKFMDYVDPAKMNNFGADVGRLFAERRDVVEKAENEFKKILEAKKQQEVKENDESK